MKGFHVILTNGKRYRGVGETVPKPGDIIGGFVVDKVGGKTEIYVRMPRTDREWMDYKKWERDRKNGAAARRRDPKLVSP